MMFAANSIRGVSVVHAARQIGRTDRPAWRRWFARLHQHENPLEQTRTRVLLFLIGLSVVGELALIGIDLSRGSSVTNNVVVLACMLAAVCCLVWRQKTLAIYLTLLPFTADFFRSYFTSGGIETHAMPLFFLLIIEAVYLLETAHALVFALMMLAIFNADPILGISDRLTANVVAEGTGHKALVVANVIAVAITALFTTVFLSQKKYFHRLEEQNAHLDDLVRKRTSELEAERQRSDELLHNVLPTTIAARMKSGEVNLVDHYGSAGVLFADIVGFTELSKSLQPAELVDLLNERFSAYDRLVDQHNLEKIKTIGDAYMVASGIPEPSQDSLDRLADFALDLRDLMNAEFNESGLKIRIGMNAGPVVAGVIGSRKFLYDLWGETVNLASRMESQGVPGRVHLPTSVSSALSSRFSSTPNGLVNIKGVGPVETSFLDR